MGVLSYGGALSLTLDTKALAKLANIAWQTQLFVSESSAMGKR